MLVGIAIVFVCWIASYFNHEHVEKGVTREKSQGLQKVLDYYRLAGYVVAGVGVGMIIASRSGTDTSVE